MEDYKVSPFNRIPPVVLAIAALALGIEIVFQLGAAGLIGGASGVGLRIRAYQEWSFVAPYWQQLSAAGRFPPEDMARFVTFSFLHARAFDAFFATALFVALGKGVSDSMTPWAVPVIFIVSSAAGALAYGTFIESNVPLSSLFTVNFGLIGAITYIRALNLKDAGQNQLLALKLIGLFMVFRLVWGIVAAIMGWEQDYQWVSELTGFFVGLLLCFIFEPRGRTVLIEIIRRR